MSVPNKIAAYINESKLSEGVEGGAANLAEHLTNLLLADGQEMMSTFVEAGIMTNNVGLLVTCADQQYQVTTV